MTWNCSIYTETSHATAFGVRFEENKDVIFQGDFISAAKFLRNLGVGVGVVVHHDGGIHSCMNKPELWKWLENRDSRIIGFEGKFRDPRKGKPFTVPVIESGIVGEYYNGKPYAPDLSQLVQCVPYRYRIAAECEFLTMWHESGHGPNDGTFKVILVSTKGKYLTQILFTPIRE